MFTNTSHIDLYIFGIPRNRQMIATGCLTNSVITVQSVMLNFLCLFVDTIVESVVEYIVVHVVAFQYQETSYDHHYKAKSEFVQLVWNCFTKSIPTVHQLMNSILPCQLICQLEEDQIRSVQIIKDLPRWILCQRYPLTRL